MEPKKYKIETLEDMLAIPREARARFADELPDILNSIEQLQEAMPSIAEEAHARAPRWAQWMISTHNLAKSLRRQTFKKVQWVDDDKMTGTINVALRKGGAALYSRSVKMGDD